MQKKVSLVIAQSKKCIFYFKMKEEASTRKETPKNFIPSKKIISIMQYEENNSFNLSR